MNQLLSSLQHFINQHKKVNSNVLPKFFATTYLPWKLFNSLVGNITALASVFTKSSMSNVVALNSFILTRSFLKCLV